jgi:hypothetical protein
MDLVFGSWDDITITENHIKQLHRDLLVYSEKDERHRGAYKVAAARLGTCCLDSRRQACDSAIKGGVP